MDTARDLDMDDLTAKLIIQMQMEDMESLTTSSKNSGNESGRSDAEIAMDIYKQDLQHNATFISDLHMTRSIAQAVESDGKLLFDTIKEDGEDEEETDELGGSTGDEQIINDEVLDKLAAKYFKYKGYGTNSSSLTKAQKESMESGESSAWAANRTFGSSSAAKEDQTVTKRECISCLEDKLFFDLARAPCDHEYCRTCLRVLFGSALADESLFPPRCCGEQITIGSVRMWLDSDLVLNFHKKKEEYDTPNRIYCHVNTCSEWIRPENIEDEVATCQKCMDRTCTLCKAAVHGREGCPEDVDLQLVHEMARENEWQQCRSCSRIVELTHGCMHIRCVCGAHFCYTCGEVWKTCDCPLWEEELLFDRANALVDREEGDLVAQDLGIGVIAGNLRGIRNPFGMWLPPHLRPAPVAEQANEGLFVRNQVPGWREVVAAPNARPAAPIRQPALPNPARAFGGVQGAAEEEARAGLIANVVHQLRENPECDRHAWKCIRGPHDCEHCNWFAPEFSYECKNCRLRVCRVCRNHRL